jgi:hypothetical protein
MNQRALFAAKQREHGYPWDEHVLRATLRSRRRTLGHVEVAARTRMCLAYTYASPAKEGHWDRLLWARETGAIGIQRLAKGGRFIVLQRARRRGCPWDEWTCAHAAKKCHLDVLK